MENFRGKLKRSRIEFEVVADPQIDTFLGDKVVEPRDHMRIGPDIPIPREPGERDGNAEQLVGPPLQPRGLGVYDHHRSVVNAWEFGHQNGMSSDTKLESLAGRPVAAEPPSLRESLMEN